MSSFHGDSMRRYLSAISMVLNLRCRKGQKYDIELVIDHIDEIGNKKAFQSFSNFQVEHLFIPSPKLKTQRVLVALSRNETCQMLKAFEVGHQLNRKPVKQSHANRSWNLNDLYVKPFSNRYQGCFREFLLKHQSSKSIHCDASPSKN